ncbi:MAG: hypothetical protein AMJ91_02770, partial [candidate division Zixibacteria bacterium SM23_73_3]
MFVSPVRQLPSYYNGNVARMIEAYSEYSDSSKRALKHKYDGINRLVNVREVGESSDLETFQHDENSNISVYVRSSLQHDYSYYDSTNRLKRVSNWSGQTDTNYLYDANGNMTQDSSKAITLDYDYRNMLT